MGERRTARDPRRDRFGEVLLRTPPSPLFPLIPRGNPEFTQRLDAPATSGKISNETEMTKGELGIAPSVSISISEITPKLMAAKKRALQPAILKCCSRLNITEALIDLGFSQVVVMREHRVFAVSSADSAPGDF